MSAAEGLGGEELMCAGQRRAPGRLWERALVCSGAEGAQGGPRDHRAGGGVVRGLGEQLLRLCG